jgi:hypothetical protein
MNSKHWFEVHVDEGEKLGTHTIQCFDVLPEARAYKQKLIDTGEYLEKDLHIDEWKNTDNPTEVRSIE